jgi:hypothetical protein
MLTFPPETLCIQMPNNTQQKEYTTYKLRCGAVQTGTSSQSTALPAVPFFQFHCLTSSWTLKMEAVHSS